MEHALITIQESANAQVAKAPPALITGKLSFAPDLVSAFVEDSDTDKKRVGLVFSMAQTLLPNELDETITTAIESCALMDKCNGWKPEEGVKGRQAYGPKKSSMASRATEIRQLFGALKFTASNITPSLGYIKAVAQARMCLKGAQLTWDGRKAQNKEEKQKDHDTKELNKLRLDWMKEHPQQSGETMRDYNERMLSAVEYLFLDTQKEREEAHIEKLASEYIQKHGLDIAALVAERIIEAFNSTLPENDGEPTQE